MKRKSYGATPVKVIKTSISLPEVLLKFAEERCAHEGFNSFSAYVAHLVRMDKERREAGKPVDHGTSPHVLNEANSSQEASDSAEIISETESHLGWRKTSKKKPDDPQK